MVSFSIPLGKDEFFTFSIEPRCLVLAGSRKRFIDKQVCSDLISAFGSLGFSFLTGCAKGVDECFRHTLATSDYADTTIVACAFKERAQKLRGIYRLIVAPQGLPPRVALAKRTLWMTSRCTMLLLFPSDPIGKGSALAFKSAIMNNKPVFVVSSSRPKDSDLYSVYPSNLFGTVNGFWCVPPTYQDTGLCYEQV